MIKTGRSRSGDPIIFVNGISIHSKYDPSKEAENFVKSQSYPHNINRFIIIGPGIGYINQSIKKIFPNAMLLSLHMDKQILNASMNNGISWAYNEKLSLKKVLENFVPDFLLSTTSIIKWLPCTECFPDRIIQIEKTIQQFSFISSSCNLTQWKY